MKIITVISKKIKMGSYRYESLSGDSVELGLITKIIFNDSLVWFYSERTLSCYNIKTGKLQLRLNCRSRESFYRNVRNPEEYVH